MPNCDFYAHGDDFEEVLRFVFDQPGWALHELASRLDEPVVVFSSAAEVFARCAVGVEPVDFQLYAPEMRGRVIHKRIDVEPSDVEAATHRFSTEGWGLIQLNLGYERNGGISHCHTNHNSAQRARTWSATPGAGALDDPSLWDWNAVARVSGRLNRFVKKVSASKRGSRPILPAAHGAVTSGAKTLLLNR